MNTYNLDQVHIAELIAAVKHVTFETAFFMWVDSGRAAEYSKLLRPNK